MNVITHSLLPIVAKQAGELRLAELPAYRQQIRGWLAIAFFGSLPDLLNPHLSLGARYSSYSHVWPCTALVLLGCCVWYLLCRRQQRGSLALWCGFAYALHIAGDIASGGVDFLASGHVLGDYWVTPELWPVCDVVLLVAFELLHRRLRARQGLTPSVIAALRRRSHAGARP